METLFENSYIRDKKHYKELYNYFFFRRPAMIICHIIILIVLITTSVDVILFGWIDNYAFSLVMIFIVILRILNYFLQVNSVVKRDREMFDGSPSVKITVTEEYIEHTLADSITTQMKFDKIKRGIETKKLIMLRSKANLVYILPKECFSKGNAEELKEFIRGKGIKIK